MANPQVIVDFIANTSGLHKGMAETGSNADSLGSKLKGMGKTAVVAAGAAGLAALGATLKVGIDEFTESTKVAAQTQAVLKSTGGAAGVTASQVGNLATKLMLKSGTDDEAIQSGENLLLTFRNIQDQTGKGNDIFTRATGIMLDMSTALGQDTKTSAIQLGKALNDPIKGVSSLQRVGVSFTDSQKDQIKALVESGHTLQAQKIILGELTKEFGGSAAAAGKTLPGQLNILKESFNNLAGSIVGTLAPAFEIIAKFFVQNPGLAKVLVLAILGVSAAMVALNAVLAITAALTAEYTVTVLAIIAAVTAFIAIGVLLWKNWDKITGALTDGFDAIKRAALDVFSWLKSNWPLLLGILTGPIGTAVALIVTHWNTVKSVTTAAFDAVKSTITNVWNAISGAISNAVDAVVSIVTGAWAAIKTATGNLWPDIRQLVQQSINTISNLVTDGVNAIKGVVTGAWNAIKTATGAIWPDIRQLVGDAISAITGLVTDGMNAVKGVISGAWAAIKAVTTDAWGAVRATVTGVVADVKTLVTGLAAWLTGTAGAAIRFAVGGIHSAFSAIADGARAAVQGVKDAVGSLVGFITGIAGAVGNAARSVADAIKSPINAVLRMWNSLEFPHVGFSIPSVKILGHKFGGQSIGFGPWPFPNIPLLAAGAVVDQPTLAVVGEAGRELVTPERLLRQILAEQRPHVRVFIGDTELRGLVRTEVDDASTGLARTLIAGGAA